MNPLIERVTYFLSGVCVLHCLLTPFVILLIPVVAPAFNSTIESILVLAMVPLAFFAFLPSWLRHKNKRLLLLFLTGIFLILSSQFFFHPEHQRAAELTLPILTSSAIMLAGASLMAYSIFKNRRHTHVCSVPDHEH